MIPDLNSYHAIVVNSSAGKDSQAMLDYVVKLCDQVSVPRERITVAHADLGKAEWPGTRELAEKQAQLYNLAFTAIKRPQGDLLEHIRKRRMFPSPTNRYCTSDHKRGQIAKVFTKLAAAAPVKPARILNCMGFRAEESPARAKRQPFVRDVRASNGRRHVDTWLPIHNWSEAQVWERIKASGVPYHSAYDLGMPRLSCRFCIFAPRAALLIAGRANPELLAEYVELEKEIGHTFRKELPLADIQKAIEAGEQPGDLNGAWNM